MAKWFFYAWVLGGCNEALRAVCVHLRVAAEALVFGPSLPVPRVAAPPPSEEPLVSRRPPSEMEAALHQASALEPTASDTQSIALAHRSSGTRRSHCYVSGGGLKTLPLDDGLVIAVGEGFGVGPDSTQAWYPSTLISGLLSGARIHT